MELIKKSDLAIHSSWSTVNASHSQAKPIKPRSKRQAFPPPPLQVKERHAYSILANECGLPLLSLWEPFTYWCTSRQISTLPCNKAYFHEDKGRLVLPALIQLRKTFSLKVCKILQVEPNLGSNPADPSQQWTVDEERHRFKKVACISSCDWASKKYCHCVRTANCPATLLWRSQTHDERAKSSIPASTRNEHTKIALNSWQNKQKQPKFASINQTTCPHQYELWTTSVTDQKMRKKNYQPGHSAKTILLALTTISYEQIRRCRAPDKCAGSKILAPPHKSQTIFLKFTLWSVSNI